MKRFNLYMTVFVILFTLSTFSISTAETSSFCNSGAISIPTSGDSMGAADPYPSDIDVSDLTGSIENVTVTLEGLFHTYPSDIGVLLVGPEGQSLILMSGAGRGLDIVDMQLTFDDAADTGLPAPIISGTYKPSNDYSSAYFPSPAPTPSDATTLATFNGTNPDGTWSLYVYDYIQGDFGAFEGGWCVTITTPDTVVDSDGDGICDDDDYCTANSTGAYVDEYGCSGEQLVDEACPCDFDWKNHGEYVRCVAHAAEEQLADGLITLEEKCAIVAERAKGDCGAKKK